MSKKYDLENLRMTDYNNCWSYTDLAHRSGMADFPPVMIACAITGGNHGKEANPNLPESVEEQVEQAVEAVEAGASMLHIHRRDPNQPHVTTTDPELYREVNIKIREKCPDVIINDTAAGGRSVVDGVRGPAKMVSVPAEPEIASLDSCTYTSYVKLPAREGVRDEAIFRETIYTITQPEVMSVAKEMQRRNIKPEFECFSIADFWYIERLMRDGYTDHLGGPHLVNFVFTGGSNWPTPLFLTNVVYHTPRNSVLLISATGAQQWPIISQAICHGANVRVGMEDNVYYAKGRLAKSNGELVEKVAKMAELVDRKVATCDEARKMLGLGTPRTW